MGLVVSSPVCAKLTRTQLTNVTAVQQANTAVLAARVPLALARHLDTNTAEATNNDTRKEDGMALNHLQSMMEAQVDT